MNTQRINIIDLSFILTAGILFILLFWTTFVWLYGRWTAVDSYYSHGFLVPIISGWLLWRSGSIKGEYRNSNHDKVSIVGLIISIFIHIIGIYLRFYFLSGLGLILFIIFAGWYLIGSSKFKTNWFPFVFLFLMLPLPSLILEKLTVPLKMIVTKLSVFCLILLDIPYLLKGFEVELPGGSMFIDNPCSGLRSLISFLSVSLLLCYISNLDRLRSLIVIGATIPLSIMVNILRVQFLLLVAYYFGVSQAIPGTPAHDYSGLVMFILGIFAFFLFTNKICKLR
jgi:exosortase